MKTSHKFRVKIANMLISLAMLLTPKAQRMLIQKMDKYKAQQIGTAWGLTKKDINKFLEANPDTPKKEAREATIKEILGEQREAILTTAASIIEYRTYNKHGQTIIESRLNVYVPKEAETDAEAEA